MFVVATSLTLVTDGRCQMNCLQVHNLITGTTITLPRRKSGASAGGASLDIVRPNGAAAALVSAHLARLSALGAKRRPARRAA
jgi:hypothetical protein